MSGSPPAGRSGQQASVAFLGPALGRHAGWVTTQGEVLAGLFSEAGHVTHTSSGRIAPLRRAADHAVDLVRWRRHVDVVVVSVFSGRAFLLADESLTLARVLGLPTVAWLHGGNLPDFSQDHHRWVRRVLRHADAVVAPSAYLARWAEPLVNGVLIIPNVLDLADYPFRQRQELGPRLLWMRTFQELYDPLSAVHVLSALVRSGIEATLTMAGQDKGLLRATQVAARDQGVADRITFAGFVSGQEKAALLDGHDIFLNTNLVDNAPVTVLEAACSGLVVISTDVGGLPDLLENDVSALLVPPSDPSAMANAARRVLADQELAARLRGGARVVAEQSGWPAVRNQWTGLFAGLHGERK